MSPATAADAALAAKTCLAIIPARGGSQGIPRKNARLFGGTPLLARAVQGALLASRVTRAIVSTDDAEMLDIAVAAGADAPFGLRPAALGTHTARTVDVLAHAVDWIRAEEGVEYDMIVMLQPTSPFRTAADIDGAVGLLVENWERFEAVVSVCEAAHHPMKMHKIAEGRLEPFVHNPYGTVNRKELPAAWQENGAMYVQRTSTFQTGTEFYCGLKSNNIAPYVMDASSSIDLDNETDWKIGEILLEMREKEQEEKTNGIGKGK